MEAEREQYESADLFLPGTLTLGRHAEVLETLRTQEDVFMKEWAVNQRVCDIYSVRSVLLALVKSVVHLRGGTLFVRPNALPPAHFIGVSRGFKDEQYAVSD